MEVVSATYAKQNFAAVLDRAQRNSVIIRRHDRDIAVLISTQDFETLRQLRIKELIALTEESGRYAESQGMTDELLEQLLADES
jgi:prevent-host-death family protein